MKCSDARHLIHLSAGDDNLPEEEQALAVHLHECAECRSYSAGMMDAMQVLHTFREDTTVVAESSVWPAVERRIHERRSVSRVGDVAGPQRQFSGGVVALCACSLVLAFITIVQSLPANQSGTAYYGPDQMGAQSVSTGAGQAGTFVPVQSVPEYRNGRLVGFHQIPVTSMQAPVGQIQNVPVQLVPATTTPVVSDGVQDF